MILCAGEALIDMLPRTSSDGEACFAPYAGGAVFNTSVALGRLGSPAGLFTGLSQDLFGEMLEQALTTSHVDASLCARSDRPTTLAFVRLIDGQASYAFNDENTAGRMIDTSDLPTLPKDLTAAFFGGISLAVEPCALTFEALLADASKSVPCMIDPNIRPSFIKDEARYRARIDRMLAQCDLVKLSDEDLHWLRGPGDLAQKANEILAMGPKVVCITEGAKGVTGYTRTGATFVAAEQAEVVDTVGAGDTFNAGFLAGLHRAGALSKTAVATLDADILTAALTLGVKSAAITVARAGANPPWAEEIT